MTDKLREAALQALEVLEQLQGGCTDSDDGTFEAITIWCPEVIDAIRAALAEQTEQEPTPDWISYNKHSDVLTIRGRRYDAALFDERGFGSPPGTLLRIVDGPADVVTLERVAEQQDAQAVPQPSPTAGMNIAQRILHVGGRNNAAGYVEFGSIQAVEALVRQVIRDLPELVELENLRHSVKVYREATALMLNAAPTPPAQQDAQAAPLEPVYGDVLPPIGSRVFIRHGRDDDAHACTVTGYYAWPDLGGSKFLHRVFVRMVYEGTEIQQARLLRDCYKTAEAALNAAPTPPAPKPLGWLDRKAVECLQGAELNWMPAWNRPTSADPVPVFLGPPAQRVMLTDEDIREWWVSENGLEDCDMTKLDDFTKVVRAVIEAYERKNAQPKTLPAPLEQQGNPYPST